MTDGSRADLSLRMATEADVQALVRIWFDVWPTATPQLKHPDPIERWQQRFQTEILPNETVLVAERDGRVVGFMALREQDAYLHLLYVLPDAQGSGVGSLFLNEAMKRCPEGLRLTTLEPNTHARRFYERHGWVAGLHGQNARTGHPTVAYSWSPRG